MNTHDLIQLTLLQGDFDANAYSWNGKKTKMPVLISPSSIASVEPINPEYGTNSRITLKEYRGERSISYEVVETIEEITKLLKAEEKHKEDLFRPITYVLDREARRGYFHRWITSKWPENGEEYALALIEDTDGSVRYIDVVHGDITFVDKGMALSN